MKCVYEVVIDGRVAFTYANRTEAEETAKELKAHGFNVHILPLCTEEEES